MKDSTRIGITVGLWALAIGGLTVRTILGHAYAPMGSWSLLVGMVASIVTVWHLMVKERCRIEHIARLAVNAAAEHAKLSSVSRSDS